MAPLNKKEVRNRMEEIMIESNHSTKPVYIPKRGKKKNYCKSDDKHQEKQKEKHEDVKKRTSKS